MKNYKTVQIKDYPFNQNAYVVINQNQEAIIIDPGYGFNDIKMYLSTNNLKAKAILLTHYHFDHVVGVDNLCEELQIKAYININDFQNLIEDTLANKFGFETVEVNKDNVLPFEDSLDIEGFEIKTKNLSGHSKGSTLFFIEDQIFTGDVLFINSIGRTDLHDSSPEDMKKSLEWIKANIEPEQYINPGHGDAERFANVLKVNKLLY